MFHAPYWLALSLLLLPAAWGLQAWARARRARVAEALGKIATLARVSEPARRYEGLRLAALALLLLALAGPQFGVELVETRTDARQAVIAVDVSLSMMTPDVRPTRLERAKSSLSLLIEQLRGERIGVVAFAGEAQTICPLTQDADAAKQLLGALEVGAIPTPGTSVGGALRASVAMLGRYPGGKAVILLTDGEDHKSDPLGAAREAAAAGVRVYTVGIGTPDGEPIPGENGTYHKDSKGVTVVSRLDENTLVQIAKETGGAYYRTTPGSDEIADIAHRVRELDTAKGLTGSTSLWRDRFAWPASAAFLLLLLELALGAFGGRTERFFKRGKAGALVAAAVVALLGAPARAATTEGLLREGNHQYGKERYEDALAHYGEAALKTPLDPRPAFNSGDALYRLGKPADSAEFFSTVAARGDLTPAMRAGALYNLGDARFKAGELPAAAAAFRAALALSPSDADARHNLAVTIKRMKTPSPPKKQDDKKKNDPDKPDDKKPSPNGGGGEKEQPKNQTKTRPQDQLTKEEAERILRAVNEREKQTQKQVQEGKGRRVQGSKPPTGEDW